MQQIKKVAQPFPEIFAICYFGERWTCPGMSDQTHQILHDLTKASMDNLSTSKKWKLHLK